MTPAKCSLITWACVLSARILCLSIMAAAAAASSSSLPLSLLRGQPRQPTVRSLADVDGATACSDCSAADGKKCVGRTVQDESCDDCSKGQTFWPCNLKKECWCWDTSGPRDPGDEADKSKACSGCGRGGDTEVCVSNQNSLIPVGDEECKKCMEGQSFWPCDDADLCWCWDTTKPKKPPAPASGLTLAVDLDPNVPKPCEILTKEKFMVLAPNSTFPYTYDGLCNAIDDYNKHHTEKFAAHGTVDHIKAEIAAFLGNTAHESDDFEAAREYLACGDRKEVDGKVYCKPCNNDLYDWVANTCSVSMVDQNAPYNSYCQPSFAPPEGCVCDTITQVEESGPLAGYVEASKVFYGRGAIQLSWNYNYIRASYALTGKAETFCEDPEQVATKPEYAWGSGIYFWMENQKEGSTCHKEALKGDFGGTLNNINGGLECPAYKGGWHADAIKMRLNRYCHAATELGMEAISSLDGCKGMTESFDECLLDGHCPYCERYAGIPTKTFDNTDIAAIDAPTPEETTGEPTPAPVAVAEETNEISPAPVAAVVTPAPFDPPTQSPASVSPTPNPSSSPVNVPTSPSPTAAPSQATTTAKPSKSPVVSPTSPPVPEPTSSPSFSPTTAEPSSSPVKSPSAAPTTSSPSYSPTTPMPTMGPCDGEPCPGEMCRSEYGFCGTGPNYCNMKNIWSAKCREDSKRPTPSPSNTITNQPSASPAEKATPILDSVFSVTRKPTSEPHTSEPTPHPTVPETSPSVPQSSNVDESTTAEPSTSPSELSVNAGLSGSAPLIITGPISPDKATNEPTKAPSVPAKPFVKPMGGKKPAGGKKPTKPATAAKPGSSSKPATVTKPSSGANDLSQQTPATSEGEGGTLQNDSPPEDEATATGHDEVPEDAFVEDDVLGTNTPTPQPSAHLTPDPATPAPMMPAPGTPEPLTPAPAPLTMIPTVDPTTYSPTLRPTEKPFSPTDPEATYFCGKDWGDANASCHIRCPSSLSEDCPGNHKCFAFTSCMEEEDDEEMDEPADQSTNPQANNAGDVSSDAGESMPSDATNASAMTPAITPAPTEKKPDGCTGKPCPFAGECRSQYGFCGSSFIYCNALSSWKLEKCGLAGHDEHGEPVLCDAGTFKCADSTDEVYRDPNNECSFFPCPVNEEEEDAITASAFNIPATSPTKFEALPRPTLPTISKPTPYTLPSVSKPSVGTIDLGKKPSGTNTTIVVVGESPDVASDDGEESAEKSSDEDQVADQDGDDVEQDEEETTQSSPTPDFAGVTAFSAEEWLASSAHTGRVTRLWVLLTVPIAAIIAT